jgi:hypothetical protein
VYERALPDDAAKGVLPVWVDGLGSRPLVYVSVGTVFNGSSGPEIFSKLLTGIRDCEGHELNATPRW